MSAGHSYDLSTKGRSSAVTDVSSTEVSRNCGSLLNVPPTSPHAAVREEKSLQRPLRRLRELAHGVKMMPEPNVCRSRTPHGETRRVSIVAANTPLLAGVDRAADLMHDPLPAAITTRRAPANTNGSELAASAKRLSVSAELYSLLASVQSKKQHAKVRHPMSSSDNTAAPKPPRSRSAGPSVSVIRPRTSVGLHLSDGACSCDLNKPIPSSTVAAQTAMSPQPTFSVSSRAVSMERAPCDIRNNNISGAACAALATPRVSLQNVDDIAQLMPVHATVPSTIAATAAAPAPTLAIAKRASCGALHQPREAWGGMSTSLLLLPADCERAKSEGALQGRLSGTTFSCPVVEESSKLAAPAPTTRFGKPVKPNRVAPAGLHPQRASTSSLKDPRRRSVCAGPSNHRTTKSAPNTTTAPAPSLTKIKQAFLRGSSPSLVSRGSHCDTLPGAAGGAETASGEFGVRLHNDSLAVSAPSLHNLSEPEERTSNDFLSHAVLNIDEVRTMDSDPSSLSPGAAAAAGANVSTGGATPCSYVLRGTSTPRAYSPHAESSSFTASPVSRPLRGKTEVSTSTTPRFSASTPRFTVATTNSLPYTARLSREGTPITGSLSPSASINTATATAYPATAPNERLPATPPRQGGSPTASTAPPRTSAACTQMTDMERDSQNYVAAVAEQVTRHYYTILTALDIGRGAALQADPPSALCLQSMVVDLNTVASLLSYDSRNGIADLLFDDCAFATMDLAWLTRLHHLTALRFKGPRVTTAMVNRLLLYAPTVQILTLINTSRLTSLASIATPESRVHTLQLIQTDFTAAAFENIVNSPMLRHVMLLQVQLRTNIFDLLNTNHLTELHLVGCPDIYYEGLPEAEWVSSCSPRHEKLTLPAVSQESEKKPRAVRSGRGRVRGGSASNAAKRPQQQQHRPLPPAFPLRVLVIADCPELQLSTVPFEDFRQLEEVSIMYQRGVRASDLAGVLQQGKLVTLRLQEVFVDDYLVQQLCKCRSLRDLNLSFCRGMREMKAVWPALIESLRVLNVSYSDIDDDGLVGLEGCRLLCNVYARGCSRLRSFDPFRRLADSVRVIDLTDCSGLENDAFSKPFNCTGVHRLLLTGCSKVRAVTGLSSLRVLEDLSLANTSVDDTTFVTLALDADAVVLHTLTKLDLSGCRYIGDLTNLAATSTTALRNLAHLNLSRSSISNSGVANIAHAVQSSGNGCLSELDVSGCTGVSQLGPLGAIKSLRTLNAAFSAVDDDGLAAFVKASVDCFNKELRVLNLSGCTGVSNVGCIGQLSRLAVLNLAGTTVDGPASFVNLANCAGLRELDLSECMHLTSVTELVPGLTKLLSLNLSLTSVGDDSVAAVGESLKDLEVLQLSGCPRVTCIAALGSLSLLQRLNLSATRVTDVAPLVGCPQLWDVSVCACAALTTVQPLAHARSLQRLDASSTPITSDSFQMDWDCAALEELDVHDCAALCGVRPGALRMLVSLRRVYASGAGLDDSAVAALAECKNLCEVHLSDCPVTSLCPLGAIPTLQSIVAQNTPVNDEGIAGLEVSESLSTLDLTGCKELHNVSGLRTMRSLTALTLCDSGVTDASFAAGASWARSGIRELNLSACAGIREPAMLHSLPGLELLRVSGSGLDDAGLRMVAQCAALRRLDVSDCWQLTDLSPLAMLGGLTHLDASNASITSLAPVVALGKKEAETGEQEEDYKKAGHSDQDAGDAAAADSLTCWSGSLHLRHVVLRGCPALADVSALRHLASLYSIDLTGSGVSAVSFEQSWAACVSLEEVNLSDCAALQHVRGLWAAPNLMQLRLDRTAVDSLAGADMCASLEVLEASGCRRLRSIAELRDLPRLQRLQCNGSEITDDAFAEPWTAPHLLELTLADCLQVRDVGNLGHLPRLRSVNFSNTYITDIAVRELSMAPMLEDLDFRGCSRLAHLGSLSRMPHIRTLYLSRTCIGNFTFTSVSRCKKLEVLEMEDCPYLTNVFVAFEFGQLRFLKFPPLSRMVGSVLRTCHNLEYLSLHGCPDSFEIESLSILPRLRVLDFRESAIKSSVLAALNDCPSLEEVDISYCSEIISFDTMGRLPRLRCFSAAGLPVSDDACLKLTEYPLLEKIVLAECCLLRDVSVLQRLPQLHHLDISESGAVEESFIGIRHMRALEELSVHGCTSIHSCRLLSEAPKGVSEGVAPVCLPRLRLVDLSGTGITAASSTDDVAALRRQCPLLTKVYLSGSRASSSVPSAAVNIWKKLTSG